MGLLLGLATTTPRLTAALLSDLLNVAVRPLVPLHLGLK